MTAPIALEDNHAIETFTKIFNCKPIQGYGNYKIQKNQFQQLNGTVMRRSEAEHFQYLQNIPPSKKHMTWLMGEDGLCLFLEKSNLEALRGLGRDDKWIRKKLENGDHFRLCVLYKPPECVLATWDGVLSILDNYYPNEISKRIRRHENALRTMSFDEIEERARLSYLRGATYFEAHEAPFESRPVNPRFMSEERFLQSEGTLEEARGYLYHRLGLTRLYDGSGFTKDSKGKLIAMEYLLLNMRVEHLSRSRYLDLPIDIAELEPDA